MQNVHRRELDEGLRNREWARRADDETRVCPMHRSSGVHKLTSKSRSRAEAEQQIRVIDYDELFRWGASVPCGPFQREIHFLKHAESDLEDGVYKIRLVLRMRHVDDVERVDEHGLFEHAHHYALDVNIFVVFVDE